MNIASSTYQNETPKQSPDDALWFDEPIEYTNKTSKKLETKEENEVLNTKHGGIHSKQEESHYEGTKNNTSHHDAHSK